MTRIILLNLIFGLFFPLVLTSQPNLTILDDLTGKKDFNDVKFSPDGKFIAFSDYTVKIKYIDGPTVELFTPTELYVNNLTFSPDGKYLAGGCINGKILIWDLQKINKSSPPIYQLSEHSGAISCLTFSNSSKYLASGAVDKLICIWDTSDWKIISKINDHSGSITDIKFSPNDAYLASCNADDNKVYFWDTFTWDKLEYLSSATSDRGEFMKISFSPDGAYLYGLLSSWVVYEWDVFKMERRYREHVPYVDYRVFVCSPDGKYILLAKGNSIIFWDLLISGHSAIDFPGYKSIKSLAISPDGSKLTFTSGELLSIVELNPPLEPDPNLKVEIKTPKVKLDRAKMRR